jgi:hypothetical protein
VTTLDRHVLERSPGAPEVVRRGDVAAEHDRAEPVGSSFRRARSGRLSLGSPGLAGEALGLGDQRGQRRVVGAAGGSTSSSGSASAAPSKSRSRSSRALVVVVLDPARVRSASTAAAGLDATQRSSASVPQKFSAADGRRPRRRRRPRSSRARPEEALPRAGELVGQLAWSRRAGRGVLLPLGDVRPTALDEVAREALAQARGSCSAPGPRPRASKSRSRSPSSR